MTDTHARLEAILSDQSGIPVAKMHNETTLGGDLGLDSLDLISTAMRIEDEFGIQIPDDDVDLPDLGSIGGLRAYVEGKLA